MFFKLLGNSCGKSLILILLLSIILRIWGLENYPPHLRNDEASFGYNAYSILKTGRDEHGELLPFIFRSFGDWKPGLYFYLTTPFIATLGLNEWSVRIPAALSGVISIYLMYLFSLNLFKSKDIALASAFALAIVPWHVAFSRGAWDAQVSLMFILMGLVSFGRGVTDNSKYLIISAIAFGLSLLTSHGAKAAVPIILFCLWLVYWKQISKISLKVILVSSTIFILLSTPIINSFLDGKSTRVASLLFINKYQVFDIGLISSDFLKNWANHYNLPKLFLKGDGNPQHTASDFGAFLVLDVVFLFLGLKTLLTINSRNKEKLLILLLVIFTPLASALTFEGVNFERYLPFLLILTIILGVGIASIKSKLIWMVIAIPYLLSILMFLDAFFIHTSFKNAAWQYGYKQIVEAIAPVQNRYNKIYLPQGTDQPYIFFLFYEQYPPEKFQKVAKEVLIPNGSGKGMDYIAKLDNIVFTDLSKSGYNFDEFSLVIVPEDRIKDLSNSYKTIYKIKDQLGFTRYSILEIKSGI